VSSAGATVRGSALTLCVALAVALVALLVGGTRAPAATGPVLVVGDSLVIGTTPYLRRELGGVSVRSDGRIGRPSTEAVSVLRSRFSGQRVVVFDAGVNDDPAQPGRLANDLSAARGIVGGSCLVVATVSRPPYRGVSVDGLNRAVRNFAASTPTVQLVDWRAAAVSNPRLLNSDGVHPTPSGYAFRARLFAEAIASCGSGSSTSPGASPEPPPAATQPGASPPRRKRRPPTRKEPKPEPKKPAPKLDSSSPVLLDEPVTFEASGAKLKGELLAPAAEGRHPAVVMIHGAGPATRADYRETGEYLAEHGVAALIYDKRGSGESAGGTDYTYSQLAGDARAAVGLLRTRDEVDPRGIGLWGLGEGSYVAPLVAAGNPQIAAVMAVSPSAIAPASQRDWAVRRQLEAGGASAGSGPVSTYYSVASEVDDDLDFQPSPLWRRVSQPVLAVWGGEDRSVPARASAAALASALERGSNEDRAFHSFPGAAHNLGVASEGGRLGTAAGFDKLSADWLRAHLGTKRPPPTVSTPLPPGDPTPVRDVAQASLLDSPPVQIAWLLLPALGLGLVALRAWRRHRAAGADEDDERPPARAWWWPAAVVALDLLALLALAYAVSDIISVGGEGVSAVAGTPVAVLVAWVLTAGAAAATVAFAWRARRNSSVSALPVKGLCAVSATWVLLASYWLT
jgi:dienelactone hydrolase